MILAARSCKLYLRRPLLSASMALAMAWGTGAWAATPEAAAADADTSAHAEWEGAIGLTGGYGPAYPGSDDYGGRLAPGFFVRYGNVTITNAGGFITRQAETVARGLGVDLRPMDSLRLNLALRMDRGRNDDGAGPLAGMGDIDPTLRLRAGATWQATEVWRLHAALHIDALGRGGGNHGEVGIARDGRWSADTVWSLGGNLGFAVRKYMQTYHGVNAEQAARTGFPLYSPGSGLRDVSVYFSQRTELGEDWLLLAGVTASRVLGPVADSPLTRQASGWGLNGGIAWRF